jgi:hypothetical protein
LTCSSTNNSQRFPIETFMGTSDQGHSSAK